MKSTTALLVAVCISCTLPSSSVKLPVLSGMVNDYAKLLTNEQRSSLESTLQLLEQKTTAQVVILTITDTQGETVKDYSRMVFESWGLGQKGKDNGLLISYMVDKDKYRIEVGYGLEGAVTDSIAGDIIREMRTKADPKKGTKDFHSAFSSATQKISGIILSEHAKDPSGHSAKGTPGWAIALAMALFVITALAGCAHPVLGGILGAILGAVVAIALSVKVLGFILIVIIYAVIGILARAIGQNSSGGGGGFFDGGGGFSGGGGSCGGGGADG